MEISRGRLYGFMFVWMLPNRFDRVKIKIGSMVEESWVPISYEKLLEFCYYCGLIGHTLQDCEATERTMGSGLTYGSWLRAAGFHRTKICSARVS